MHFTDRLSAGANGQLTGLRGQILPFGAGCGAGVGSLVGSPLAPATNVAIGTSQQYKLGGVANSAYLVLIDFVASPSGFPIGGVFNPSCRRFVGTVTGAASNIVVVLNSSGNGSFFNTIPNDVDFIGIHLYHQGLDIVNGVATNPLETRVGR